MFTIFEVTNEQGETLVLPLEYTENGYFLKDIENLEPVKATLVSSGYANVDGEQHHSSRRESRNLIVRLKLETGPAGTVRELRSRLYAFFMPKATVHMQFHSDDMATVHISGIIESFVAPLFVKEPEATISIMCHKPDFYIPEPVIVSGNTVADDAEVEVQYAGTIETGIRLIMNVDRSLPGFTVYHRSAANQLNTLEFEDVPLVAGDVLTISTIPGAKGATLTRAGSDSSVLYGISTVSKYIELYPGTNYLRVYALGAAVPFTLEYTTKIGGL